MNQEQKKQRSKMIRESIIYWIVIFMFYGAFFGSLAPAIVKWPLWIRIVVVLLVILLPIGGQIILIFNHKKRMR